MICDLVRFYYQTLGDFRTNKIKFGSSPFSHNDKTQTRNSSTSKEEYMTQLYEFSICILPSMKTCN